MNVIFYTDHKNSFFLEIENVLKECTSKVYKESDANLGVVLSENKRTINNNIPIIYNLVVRQCDFSICSFINYLSDISADIVHVDWQFEYNNIPNLNDELIDILSVIDIMHSLDNTKLRFTSNKQTLHVSGYDKHDFSLSCFISNNSKQFVERVTVFTTNNGTFTLSPGIDMGRYSYSERYAAAIQYFIKNSRSFNNNKMKLKVNGSLRRGVSTATRGKPIARSR